MFRAWEIVRGKTADELTEMNAAYATYGKAMVGWKEDYRPSETRAKLIAQARFIELLYVNDIQQDSAKEGVFHLVMANDSQGKERNDKAYEIRPEPYSPLVAKQQCHELIQVLQCGMLNAYLSRPAMIDRPIRESETRRWLEGIKPHVNCLTPYGKSNLHHQVTFEKYYVVLIESAPLLKMHLHSERLEVFRARI